MSVSQNSVSLVGMQRVASIEQVRKFKDRVVMMVGSIPGGGSPSQRPATVAWIEEVTTGEWVMRYLADRPRERLNPEFFEKNTCIFVREAKTGELENILSQMEAKKVVSRSNSLIEKIQSYIRRVLPSSSTDVR